jgi:nudix motif 8
MDDTDATIEEAALRETEEEIALPRHRVRVLGLWDDMTNKYKDTAVTPIIGYCGDIDLDRLIPNPGEVDSIFTVPLSSLLDPAKRGVRTARTKFPMPTFESDNEHYIWGLIAYVLAGFLNEVTLGPMSKL